MASSGVKFSFLYSECLKHQGILSFLSKNKLSTLGFLKTASKPKAQTFLPKGFEQVSHTFQIRYWHLLKRTEDLQTQTVVES